MLRYVTAFLLPLAGLFFMAGCTTAPSDRIDYGHNTIPPEIRNELRQLAGPPPVMLIQPQSIRGNTYVVKRGDTLYGIARRYGCDWRNIVQLNPGIDATDLSIGHELKLPKRSRYFGPAVAVAPKPPSPVDDVSPPVDEIYKPVIVRPLPERSSAGFIWPLRGRVIRRFGDAVGGVRSHGIAIGVKAGTRVLAAKAGTAYRAEDVPGFGKAMIVQHEDGTVTFYGHNSRLLVPNGTAVAQGEVIALAGDSGRASGARLAFIICQDGAPIDPLRYLP